MSILPRISPAILSIVTVLAAASQISCRGPSMSREAAQRVSDSFMSYMVADRVGDALNEMELEFVRSIGRTEAEAQLRKLFDYCGRPLDYEFKHYEDGFKFYLDGRKKPMQKFYYAATTTQHPKGVCFFAVEVVLDDAGLKVTSFGPLKLVSSQLPPWLR